MHKESYMRTFIEGTAEIFLAVFLSSLLTTSFGTKIPDDQLCPELIRIKTIAWSAKRLVSKANSPMQCALTRNDACSFWLAFFKRWFVLFPSPSS